MNRRAVKLMAMVVTWLLLAIHPVFAQTEGEVIVLTEYE